MACYGFDGADDGVTIALGGMVPTGAHSFAALIYRGGVDLYHNVLCINNSGGTSVWAAEVSDNTAGFVNQFGVFGASGDYDIAAGAVAANVWTIVAATKAAGSSVARIHRCQSGGAWTHANGTHIAWTVPAGANYGQFGLYGTIDDFSGRMVAACFWNSVLSDAQLEALSFTSFAAWRDHAVTPNNCWKFKWEDGNLVDVIGAADETARTGTASAAEPPSWDWNEFSYQEILPDADVNANGWANTPLWSKVNAAGDSATVSATAS